jgi:hypothetical protein
MIYLLNVVIFLFIVQNSNSACLSKTCTYFRNKTINAPADIKWEIIESFSPTPIEECCQKCHDNVRCDSFRNQLNQYCNLYIGFSNFTRITFFDDVEDAWGYPN